MRLKNKTPFMQFVETDDGIVKARKGRTIEVPDKTDYDKDKWELMKVPKPVKKKKKGDE